jgi:CBS-domain-containing membrane protein
VESLTAVLAPAIAENGLTFVVFGTVAFSIVMSLLFLVTHGQDSMYDHIGQGGLSREGDSAGTPPPPAPDSPAARAEQEEEVRQMLTARSDRIVRRGGEPLDIDAEVARLLAPVQAGPAGGDPGLVEEVRQMVIARNERRVRQGQEPLDIESEVRRTMQELRP